MQPFFCVLFLLLAGCSSQLFQPAENKPSAFEIREIQTELADVKHALNSVKVDVALLEERLEAQDTYLTSLPRSNSKGEELEKQLALLEKKMGQLERMQEKAALDLRSLNAKAQQTEHQFQDFDQRFSEMAKLKNTLSSISKAMKSPSPLLKHKVKPGETLEKIARLHHTTVGAIKKINHLDHDRIYIGQDIEIPCND